jgi:small-conductance mechanosensitive channel
VDNEALEEVEEVDVISLMTEQVGDDDNEEVEDIADDTIPETVEELQEALKREREIKAKRNKSLKKSKQATHRIHEENEALRLRLDEIDRRIGQSQAAPEAENLEKEIQEWQDRVGDDPSQAVAYTDWKQSKFEEKVANYLGTQMTELREMISGLQSATNPEVIQYRDKMNALRNRDEFADLDDSVLLALAKGLSTTKIKKPRGGIGGGKVTAPPKPEKVTLSDEERQKMGF